MDKLSLKIATYFLILALCIETIAFVSFHTSLVKLRIDEETNTLLNQGNKYRNIIEKFIHTGNESRAFKIITLMESHSDSDTTMVITDTSGKLYPLQILLQKV